MRERAVIVQQKTSRPVQFELTEQTRESTQAWIAHQSLDDSRHLFPSRVHAKLESTVRYLEIEVDDALHISEQIEL